MNSKVKSNNLKNQQEVSIALIGPVGVGKSALLVKYITRRFIGEYEPFYEGCWTKYESVDGNDTQVHIYDTYDKDRKNLDKYLKWSDYLVLVYSITNYQSFLSAQEYLDGISELLKCNSLAYELSLDDDDNDSSALLTQQTPTRILLLGNKLDLERFRQVPKVEVETFIEKYSNANKNLLISYMESTLCEDYAQVQAIFHRIIRDLKSQSKQNPSSLTSPLVHNFGHSNTLPNLKMLTKDTTKKQTNSSSKFPFFNKVFK